MKAFKYLLLSLSFLCSGLLFAQSTMTDSQIMDYIVKENAKGTPRSQIVTQLMERGITVDRIQKIRRNFERQQKKEVQGAVNISGIDSKTAKRLRKSNGDVREEPIKSNKNFPTKNKQKVDESSFTPYQRQRYKEQQELDLDENLNFILPDSLEMYENAMILLDNNKKKVFGRDIFNNKKLSFESEMNIATPSDYLLGPGDAVFVDVWGASQKQFESTVSPEGFINIEGYGPVNVSGLTVAQANQRLRNTLGSRFGGSQVKLTVGQTKTITVNVMGEVKAPGTYTVSAFATVFHALYMAGGVNDIGTLRSIKVLRKGRLVSTVDIYDYILNGKLSGNIRLTSDDVIYVDTYDCLVNIAGKVKRPMFYEMKKTESVNTLLKYAGGFTGDAFSDNITLIRKSGGEMSIYSLNEFERGKFQVQDADSVWVDSVLDRYKNLVEVRGAVMRPGKYQMDGNISTVRQLIQTAGGLAEDAMPARGIIHRLRSDRTLEVKSFNGGDLMQHKEADIPLQNEDVVFIPSRKDTNEELLLTINGEVRYPGSYQYAANSSIESLILQAGGLTDKASVAKVDIARRFRDKKAVASGEQVAQFFSFSLKDGFIIDGKPDFILQPFDEVYVRTSPGYVEQQHVKVEGEVQFEGTYVITKKKYRLSDLITAAGGLTKEAYARGARLERQLTDVEKLKQQELIKIATLNDSTDIRKIQINDMPYVVIHLESALQNPGDDRWDVILREGDRLIIPQFNNTVSVSGEVMYPTTLTYTPGASLSHYIEQCGGYSLKSKKSRVFAIQMNGTVKRVRSSRDIQPGSNIVVPAKPKRQVMNLTQLISLIMSLTTLAAVAVSALKK
ncbi:SLBB domain-containing protein [Alloprevotella sp. oral taxon 473]|jgi:polysialic acid transport protein kpsD|uniref:SLBB domain-containing protein n=1 Tax=Alloprevotella sp. oral taxon 473 TaxID=712469 RepID=UPI0005C64EB7|nr:SLBB domain-containing protein [Alloprevotella sp. oral taxon 473]